MKARRPQKSGIPCSLALPFSFRSLGFLSRLGLGSASLVIVVACAFFVVRGGRKEGRKEGRGKGPLDRIFIAGGGGGGGSACARGQQ